MLCPSCGHENLPGADLCEECFAGLGQEDVPRATTRLEHEIMEMPVSALPAEEPPHLPPSTSLRKAIESMKGKRAGCVLVVDSRDRLAGIFTERDVLNRVVGHEVDVDQMTLGDFTRRTPETIRPHDTVQYALNRMAIQNFRHLPIRDEDGKTQGLITAREILNFIEDNFRETVTRAFRRPR